VSAAGPLARKALVPVKTGVLVFHLIRFPLTMASFSVG
jgi:hypothetical protein